MNLKDAYDQIVDPSGATWSELAALIEAGASDREIYRLCFARWRFLPVRAERRHVRGAEVLPLSAGGPAPTPCVHRDQFRRDDDGA